jgi:hypothetical protein
MVLEAERSGDAFSWEKLPRVSISLRSRYHGILIPHRIRNAGVIEKHASAFPVSVPPARENTTLQHLLRSMPVTGVHLYPNEPVFEHPCILLRSFRRVFRPTHLAGFGLVRDAYATCSSRMR